MKKVLLLLSIFLFSCYVELEDNFLTIPEIKINLEILEPNICMYHIYFENIYDKKESKGYTLLSKETLLSAKLFPGVYNIYIYSLMPKTEATFFVNRFKILKNIRLIKQAFLNTELENIFPSFKLEEKENGYHLKIYADMFYEVLSISSISIKQGSDRVRSISFNFDNKNLVYYAEIPFYQSGDWFMNISFSIKSKIDSNELEKNNINISTTYLSNIFLANINVK